VRLTEKALKLQGDFEGRSPSYNQFPFPLQGEGDKGYRVAMIIFNSRGSHPTPPLLVKLYFPTLPTLGKAAIKDWTELI